ncbi:hypothetical protein LTR86_008145 [Recurvomyces mirabilis]|nr:hypothetical protein LTR86_008145 [Recurvomyces mirabilis]
MLAEAALVSERLTAIQENIQMDRERREQIERFRPERERREIEANWQPYELLPEEMKEWRAQRLGSSSVLGAAGESERERIAAEQVAFRRTPGAPARRGEDEKMPSGPSRWPAWLNWQQRSRSAIHLGVGSFVDGHFVAGPSGSGFHPMIWDAPAADDTPSSSSSWSSSSDSGNEADDEAEDEAAADVDADPAWSDCLCEVCDEGEWDAEKTVGGW